MTELRDLRPYMSALIVLSYIAAALTSRSWAESPRNTTLSTKWYVDRLACDSVDRTEQLPHCTINVAQRVRGRGIDFIEDEQLSVFVKELQHLLLLWRQRATLVGQIS